MCGSPKTLARLLELCYRLIIRAPKKYEEKNRLNFSLGETGPTRVRSNREKCAKSFTTLLRLAARRHRDGRLDDCRSMGWMRTDDVI